MPEIKPFAADWHRTDDIDCGQRRNREMIPAAFHIAMACGVAYMILWRFGNTGAPHSVFIPMRRMPLTIAACIWLARHQNEEPSGLTGCFKLLALLAAE